MVSVHNCVDVAMPRAGVRRGVQWIVGIAMLALIASTSVAADVAVIEDGKAKAAIVLPAEPEKRERLAADELVEHLKLMTGAEITVTEGGEAPNGLLPIYIGSAADRSLDELSRAERDNPSSFTLRVTPRRIDVRGLTSEGTLFGAYELLEQLGFRWYMPGEFGRVVPEGDTARLREQTNSQGPTMVWRKLQHLHNDVPWARRARLGGEERSTGQHGIPGLPRSKEAFAADPEMFSLIRGKRYPAQDCLSNPKTLEKAIAHLRTYLKENPDERYIGMSSHDGGGYCECDNCKALDQGVYDPTANRESMTDRYVWFFNQILEALEDEYPDLHIVTYAYGAHMMPPAIEMHERIVPVFAPITMDRVRGMDNPMSPDRHILRWLIESYKKAGVEEMYYRGYYHNLACVQLPFSQLDRIENDTRAFADMGLTVMRVENIHTSWSSAFLDLYVATRMMWDTSTDVGALLDEFYRLYYGPAEEPMRKYHEGLEAAFRDTPYFTGSTYLYFPIFLDHPRRAELRGYLDAAAGKAEGVYTRRIEAVRLNWDRMDLFLDMIAARNSHDFATAHQKMERFEYLSTKGAAEKLEEGPGHDYALPRLIYAREQPSYSGSYFNRFWKAPVMAGYERTVEAGDLVVGLPDEWQFLIDPAELGEMAGYQRPGELGGNWKPMKTSSRSWSDQGLHHYKGIAWYRTKVEIPAEFEGRPIYLWFGGVDKIASVWVNGEFLGTSREPNEGLPGVPGSFRAFDMSATDAVRPGDDNWVVVRIENKSLSELGTGGIVGPVMFWSPKDPNWAPSKK